ncbi:phosphodiesterase [Acerihabitans arboris]|uniref:Phosphoesterase n=1 Tax=Acerihabitans arboris TaxID=2691583 RepID=A0A845SR02_9GAMM|nr:phosphodiesterase [Acerihabitans arboris]NDL65306.1 phosphodiesterase [Acerihabitans arboris]
MKLMFAADIHGSLSATRRMLAAFDASGAPWLVLLGDLLYHGPRNALPDEYQPAAVAELLNGYADRIIAVRGNCDSEVDQMLLTFPITAPWQQVLLEDARLFVTHGHLFNPENHPPLRRGDVLVYGHTHIPQAGRVEDILCFNPGSASLPKGGFAASYGLLDRKILRVVSLDTGETIAQAAINN